MHPALYTTAAALPLGAYNASQVGARKPGMYPAGEALEQLADALDKRVQQIAPGKPEVHIGVEPNTPTDKNTILSMMKPGAGTSNFASNERFKTGVGHNIYMNPNMDRSYLAHELGHVASDNTRIGNFIRSAADNKALTKSLYAAGLLGAGGNAVLTAGDDDMATSVALAYAAAAPEIADEFLANKNALAIMDTAGMRANAGQRGRLAGAMLSYLGAPLLAGASANYVGNLLDEDLPA